jgi:hypothetical protein
MRRRSALTGSLILLLLLAACSQPAQGGEYAIIAITVDQDVVGAEAAIGYDAARLEFVGISSDQRGVLVVADADGEGGVEVALVAVAEPVRGTLALASFRIREGGGKPRLARLMVVDPELAELELAVGDEPVLTLRANPAAGYDLEQVAAAAPSAQAVASDATLDAGFADYPLGDLDQNGKVGAKDARLAAMMASGEMSSPSDHQRYHGDLNSNGVVNTLDVVAILRKRAEGKLEPELQVAPRVLDLELGTSSLILVGNAGNLPLPEINVTAPPGVNVSDITQEGASGRVYRVEAMNTMTSGAIVLDAGLAGKQVVALNAALSPALCEAYEPNDTREQAAPIEPGTILATLCTPWETNVDWPYDVDWYSFALEVPSVVSLDLGLVSGSSTSTVYGTLYDAQGNTVGYLSAANDPYSGSYGEPFTAYVPAGSYALELSGYSFADDDLAAVYNLRFASEEPSVPPRFEASAGTANVDHPYGVFDGNLLALGARQSDGSPLPYDVLVYIEVPGYGTLPFLHRSYDGPVFYHVLDFTDAPLEPAATALGSRDAGWLDRLVGPRGLGGQSALSPAAVLRGTFTFSFPNTTISRTVDPARKLDTPADIVATPSEDGRSVEVRFAAVPGTVEYGVAVSSYDGFAFAVSDSPAVTVALESPLPEGEPFFVEILAANFAVPIDPATGLFADAPLPERQIDISLTGLEVFPSAEPDAFEPNNTPATATAIDPDFYASNLTILPEDVDWFTFTLPAATELQAEVGTRGFAPVMGLFDADLNEVVTSDGYLYAELESGTYYLAISSYPDTGFAGNHEQEGSYYVYLYAGTWAPPPPVDPDQFEPNDNPGEATALDFSHELALTITPGDVDWFTFSLSEAATVIADIDAEVLGSPLDSVLGLFDADLNQIAVNDDFDGSDAYLEVRLEPGSYYLAVSGYDDFGFSGNHWREGFYSLKVAAIP